MNPLISLLAGIDAGVIVTLLYIFILKRKHLFYLLRDRIYAKLFPARVGESLVLSIGNVEYVAYSSYLRLFVNNVYQREFEHRRRDNKHVPFKDEVYLFSDMSERFRERVVSEALRRLKDEFKVSGKKLTVDFKLHLEEFCLIHFPPFKFPSGLIEMICDYNPSQGADDAQEGDQDVNHRGLH